jgi:hypothetical protein
LETIYEWAKGSTFDEHGFTKCREWIPLFIEQALEGGKP